ncbi:MAG: cadherin domain-containing protein, partial [Aestuariivirga sp.]
MAEFIKVGPEQDLQGFQHNIAGLTNGGYVVTWTDRTYDAEFDEETVLIHTTVYDAAGNEVSQVLNESITYFTSSFFESLSFFYVDVIGLGDGGFAVNYSVNDMTISVFNEEINKAYNSSGQLTGTFGYVFEQGGVFDGATSPGYSAQVSLTNGNIALLSFIWTDEDVTAEIFTTAGTQIGSAVNCNVNDLGFGLSTDPELSVSALNGGGFAAIWTDQSLVSDGDNSGTSINMRLFDSTAAALTGQIRVNTSTTGDQSDAVSTRLNNGNFVVVWTDEGGNGGDAGRGIKGQMFTAAGVAIGGEFIVNGTTAGNQQNASVTVLSNGKFVVVWEDSNPGADDADGCIRGQIFAEDGTKLGAEFLVNNIAAGAQVAPEVTALANGKFAVMWGGGHVQIFNAGDFIAPSIGALSANAALEYASNGTVVGTVAAMDASAITYSLVNNAGGRFAIDAMTGQITVADGLLLDREQAASHLVRVRVEDASGNVATRDFIINVGNVAPEFLLGDARANTFVGGAGADFFSGAAGNDLLDGGVGTDTLRGGFDDDRFYVDNAGDSVIEFAGQGNDTVFTTVSYALAAGSSVETLRTGNVAGTTNLILTGNAFANTILGNAGNNRIDGGAGIDDMRGSLGNDLYYVDNAGDLVTEAAAGGTDTVVASVSYALGAGVHVETLQTIDPLAATTINLTGNALNNVIRGNAGMNTIRGNAGADDMFAGADAVRDTFVFAAASDSGLGAAMDQVYNFDAANFAGDPNSDKIALHLIDADDDLAGNQAFRFVAAFTAPAPGG